MTDLIPDLDNALLKLYQAYNFQENLEIPLSINEILPKEESIELKKVIVAILKEDGFVNIEIRGNKDVGGIEREEFILTTKGISFILQGGYTKRNEEHELAKSLKWWEKTSIILSLIFSLVALVISVISLFIK